MSTPSAEAQVQVLRPAIFGEIAPIAAGVSTRHGGVSDPPYDTLNLGVHGDDDVAYVEENRRRFCTALGVEPNQLVTAGQVHGSTVRVVDAPGHVPSCDGLVTTTPNLLLAIATADCAPVLLAEPERGVVAACHAGWRGVVQGIARRTVETMLEKGAKVDATRAYVGPCLSLDAFEVGPDVAAEFDEEVVHRRDEWSRPHVDLKETVQRQLQDAGLSPGAIEVSDRCTLRETDDFFSHRASGGTTGRLFGAIVRRT